MDTTKKYDNVTLIELEQWNKELDDEQWTDNGTDRSIRH